MLKKILQILAACNECFHSNENGDCKKFYRHCGCWTFAKAFLIVAAITFVMLIVIY